MPQGKLSIRENVTSCCLVLQDLWEVLLLACRANIPTSRSCYLSLDIFHRQDVTSYLRGVVTTIFFATYAWPWSDPAAEMHEIEQQLGV